MESSPNVIKPSITGNTADTPIPTNINALYGLHEGVLNLGKTETVVQATPREQILELG